MENNETYIDTYSCDWCGAEVRSPSRPSAAGCTDPRTSHHRWSQHVRPRNGYERDPFENLRIRVSHIRVFQTGHGRLVWCNICHQEFHHVRFWDKNPEYPGLSVQELADTHPCGQYPRLSAGPLPGATAPSTWRRPAPEWLRASVHVEDPDVEAFLHKVMEDVGFEQILYWQWFCSVVLGRAVDVVLPFSAAKWEFMEVLSL